MSIAKIVQKTETYPISTLEADIQNLVDDYNSSSLVAKCIATKKPTENPTVWEIVVTYK